MTWKQAMMEACRRSGEDRKLTIDGIRHADSLNPSFDSNRHIPAGNEEKIIAAFHQMQADIANMSDSELESYRRRLVGKLEN